MSTDPLNRNEVAVGAAWARRLVGSPASALAARRVPGTVQHRAASLQPASYDADARTIEVVFTTGAAVVRSTYVDGTYNEVLATGPSNVRLERLNAGAPLLDSHNSGELAMVLGAVVPGSARMTGGAGVAKVRLSDAARAADTVADIRDGIIRNVSVGYLVHAYDRSEGDGTPTFTVTDWEPVEISAVAVPADAGAQFRALPSTSSRPGEAMPQTETAAISRSAVAEGTEHFRREATRLGLPVAPPRPPTDLETRTRRWAEAMRADGTLGTDEAGRALAARLGISLEPRP